MTISSRNTTKDDEDDDAAAWTEEEAGAGRVGGTTSPPRGGRARAIVEGEMEVVGMELRADHNSRLKIAEVGEDFELGPSALHR